VCDRNGGSLAQFSETLIYIRVIGYTLTTIDHIRTGVDVSGKETVEKRGGACVGAIRSLIAASV